jgi:hypothetical protein
MELNPNDVGTLLGVMVAGALFIGAGSGFVLGVFARWFFGCGGGGR